ncbi:MAG: hypothetical protein ACOC5T_00905 [Elusimicrobiota bacterium]
MIICKICKKKFKSKVGLFKHIAIWYGKEKKSNVIKHMPVLAYRAKYLDENCFSKDYLEREYTAKKKTTVQISKELEVYKRNLLSLMHYYGIKLRNRSEATKNQIKRDGLWNKGLTKWDHASIMKYAKQRIGKNNPFYTAPGYELRKQKFLKVASRGRQKACNARQPKTTELRMMKILDHYKISYVRNFALKYIKEGFKHWFLYDFLIDDNILIELNGDYWHANPKFYSPDDIVNVKGFKYAKEIWKWDNDKINLAKIKEYKCFVLWENEMNKMCDREILEFVNDKRRDI